MSDRTMVEALNLALHQEMENDDSVLVLGADVGVDGGVFRVTEGLIEEFGEKRVIDTPLAEGAIVGTSIGMAVYGLKPICETQFSGFSYYAFQQLESHAARLRWRSRHLSRAHGPAHALCGGYPCPRTSLREPRSLLGSYTRPEDGHSVGAEQCARLARQRHP